MRNCEIVNEVFYKGKHYYEVVTKNSNKHFYFKDFSGDDIKIISKEEYDKIINSSKGLSTKNRMARKLILPVILSGMISSSLSGCSKNSDKNAEPTKIEVTDNKDDNKKKNNNYTVITSEYYNPLTIKDLEKYGVEFIKKSDCSYSLGNNSVYEVNNLDFSKIPDNKIFRNITKNNYIKSKDFDMIVDVTWDDCIELINQKNIDDKYKKVFVNAIEKYKNLGLEKGLPILYQNIKNTNFIINRNHPSAQFSSKSHELTIGNVEIDDFIIQSKDKLIEKGFFDEKEFEDVLTQYQYILTHELAHMIAIYYDDQTGKDISNSSYYAIVGENDEILGIVDFGVFLAEGFADYLTFETLNRKPNKFYGYPLNSCIYITYKEMLGINSIEELRTLTISDLLTRLEELGIINAIDLLAISEDPVHSDLTALYQPQDTYLNERNSYTYILESIFDGYAYSEMEKGVSTEEITKVFNNIIEIIKNRVTTKYVNGELCVEGTVGYNYISITELEEYIKDFEEQVKKYLK